MKYVNLGVALVLAALILIVGVNEKRASARLDAGWAQTQASLAALDQRLAGIEAKIGDVHSRGMSALAECNVETGRLKQRLDIIKDGLLTPSRHNRRSGR